VLDSLPSARKLPPAPDAAGMTVVLTVVLNLSDPAAYESFAREQERLIMAGRPRPLTPKEFTARFGPTEREYEAVLEYLRQARFAVEGTKNRLTITARGTRADAERAFGVSIDDYRLGRRTFYASDRDPAVPRRLAPSIRSISGLSSNPPWHHFDLPAPTPQAMAKAYGAGSMVSLRPLAGPVNGAGQFILLPELFAVNDDDIQRSLDRAGLPQSIFQRVNLIPVHGGTNSTDTEIVLSIIAAAGVATGAASYNVYIEPPTRDFAAIFNGVLDNLPSDTVATESLVLAFNYGQCESAVTWADLKTGDDMIRCASVVHNISFFTDTGDSGSGCLGNCDEEGHCDLVPDTVVFPASSPHAIAVGGTSLRVNSLGDYQGESWWSNNLGAAGFGVSKYFPQPDYQRLFTAAAGRAVPDVSANADPFAGVTIVFDQRPTTLGGTSLAAPLWAGAWALVAQAAGPARRVATPELLYSLADSGAFHRASTMTGPGNDFSHVGLGSPNLPALVPHCGEQNEPCCYGSGCGHAWLNCVGGTCLCGAAGQQCCGPAGAQTCDSGLTCASSGSTSTCQCGGLDQECCNGTDCQSPDPSHPLVCKGFKCISGCGHRAEPCCHSPPTPPPPSHSGSSSGWCYGNEGLTCAADTCTCGGENQACCQPGASCGSGLACTNLICTRAQGHPGCSTCSPALATCRRGCTTDPAHRAACECLCQSTYCDCIQRNGCGFFCQPGGCSGP
jgi:kumamolisin